MKGTEMESNEVTAIIELLAETFGGAMATRNESERDELFQFAGALASVLTVKEMVLATDQAIRDMSDDDLQYWLHAEGVRVVGKVISGTPHCPAAPAQLQAPSEGEELDNFKRSLLVVRRYVFKRSPRRASPTPRSMPSEGGRLTDYEPIRYAEGRPHCPVMPDRFGTIPRPGALASNADHEKFRADIKAREPYAMTMRNHPTNVDPVHADCPASADKVGCAKGPGTKAKAQLKSQPIIKNPHNEAIDGEPLPLCCTQQVVTLRPPEKIGKPRQIQYWGSKKWEKMFARRTFMEGS
jgi:hypothetical protein